jgi:hypothetical protein
MFKAVYFHKTVRAGEVMLLEAMSLADDYLGLSKMNVESYMIQTDDSILQQLTSLPEDTSELKAAKKIATDYQDRKLFKCVFEKTISGKKSFGRNKLKQFREDIAKKSKLAESQIFIDTSTTHSMPLAPSKKESSSIILIKKEGSKVIPQTIPISEIPLVSSMSGKMNILRAYTQQKNRNKVEIAAKSILGEL